MLLIHINEKKYFTKEQVILFLFLLLSVLENGCTKFVQVDPPVTTLVTASVFNNDASATSAQLAIYTKMVNNEESYYLSQNTELLSDNLKNFSNGASQIQLYTNSMTANGGTTFGPWANAFNYIYQANAIIKNLQNPSGVSTFVAKQLIGEAQFIRAFWFFYLVNCYGDVPLVTTTDYTVNATIVRTPKAQIYRQMITDLLSAVNLLNANFVDATDTTITTERVRPNKGAAAALLSRVYLYVNKYDSAEAWATTVITNSLYKIDSPLAVVNNYVFNKNNTEAIWQLSTPLPTTSGATYDGFKYILLAPPSDVSGSTVAISSELLNSFEAGDLRKTVWMGSITAGSPSNTYYYPNKYRTTNNVGTTVSEYIMVLRLAEQYLIRAEARAQQGNTTDAITDLNVIRKRAGLSGYSGATDNASLLSAILRERRVELFTEWGNRWFDLKRTGAIDTVMGSPGNGCQAKGGQWDAHSKLYPIPINDINSDPNLVQNPGY